MLLNFLDVYIHPARKKLLVGRKHLSCGLASWFLLPLCSFLILFWVKP